MYHKQFRTESYKIVNVDKEGKYFNFSESIYNNWRDNCKETKSNYNTNNNNYNNNSNKCDVTHYLIHQT